MGQYAAAPVQYSAAPTMQYAAAPTMQYAAAPAYTQPSAFDAIDRNHDGIITQSELAGAMAPQPMYMQASAPAYAPYTPYQLPTAQSMVAYPSYPPAGSMVAYQNVAPAAAPEPAGGAGAASSAHAASTHVAESKVPAKPSKKSTKKKAS